MFAAMAPWVKYALWGLAGLSLAFAAYWLVKTIRRAKDADRLEDDNAEKDAEIELGSEIQRAQEKREREHAQRMVEIMDRDTFTRDDIERMLKGDPKNLK